MNLDLFAPRLASPKRVAPTLHHGDCLDVLRTLPDASVDSVVTDPPAGIAFMGKGWDEDKGGRRQWIAWLAEVMAEALRVLKPGGHALVWALPRTSHWTATALEDAGFEVRDCLVHVFGSGFPKSARVNLSQAFCQCGESARSVASSNREQPHANHNGTAVDERDDALHLAGVHRYLSEGASSRGDCPLDHGSGDALLHLSKGNDQASVPSQECAQERNRSLALAGEIASAQGGSPSRVQCSCLPSSLDSALRTCCESDASLCTPHHTKESAVPAKLTDIERQEHHTQHKVFEVSERGLPCRQSRSGFPCCQVCGKPVADGFGTALKPASEHWWLVRKPLVGTVAANVEQYGTGALNIDASRVGAVSWKHPGSPAVGTSAYGDFAGGEARTHEGGRWPPNLLLSHNEDCVEGACADGCAVAEMDRQSGTTKSRIGKPRGSATSGDGWGMTATGAEYADSGGASRFFPVFRYQAKPSKSEKGATNVHPTVKPIALMEWLIRLVTPPSGVVLDPFLGSGTTGVAAAKGGFGFIGIEREDEYLAIAQARIEADE